MKHLLHFYTKHQTAIIMFFVIIVSTATIAYLYTTNQILLYNDARSHLDIARRVTDSLTPGALQIGSVWLPLFQIFMLPFIQSYFLWHTGLAGAIVSGSAYILASFFLFKLLRLLTKSKLIAVFGLLVFALNPNLLYLQSVPLDEMLAVMMVAASMYFIFSWSKSKYVPSLLMAAFFCFLGSLVRYEVWFLLFAETFYVFISVWTDTHSIDRRRTSEGYVIAFMSLAFFGVFLWLLYNFLGWGDPLYFLHIPGGHIDQQKQFKAQGLLPTEHNLWLSFIYLVSNIFEDIGPTLFVVATLSIVYLLVHKDSLKNKLYALISLAPLGFLLLSLYFGITVLFTKTFPEPHTAKLFNVRYGIIALIPAIIMITSAFSSLKEKMNGKWIVYIAMLAIILLDGFYFIRTAPVAVIDDGKYGISAYGQEDESKIAAKVTQNCAGGLTLVSATQDEIIMFESGFQMKSFIYEGSGKYWKAALNNPQSIAKCIILSKGGQMADTFKAHPQRLADYAVIYTSVTGDPVIYKKMALKVPVKNPVKPLSIIPTCKYVIQNGDSLWKIAKKVVGDGKNIDTLLYFNQNLITTPTLHPDDILIVPCPTNTI